MRIQLWSYNFDPEPTGIGVISGTLARGLHARGHSVEVVAAHPHYPEPRWGTRLVPYRENGSGLRVLRLPLWVGRASAAERYRQELSFTIAQTVATPFLGRPDVLISASPSFPALLPAIANIKTRRVPWVLWLHDLLPDGATATGLLHEEGPVIALSRRLERAAYRYARRIVVLSSAFVDNLVAKGVPEDKLELIYDPATREPQKLAEPSANGGIRILSIGNIGRSQGLTALIRAFESRPELVGRATLHITGTGVAADEARREIRSDRVRMFGMVDDEQLEHELRSADVALVSQCYEGAEFNIPSRLMNFMAYGLPVLAAVSPAGEVAQIVRGSGGGWVVDSGKPDSFPMEVARLTRDGRELAERARAARRYAELHFTTDAFIERFERVVESVVAA